MASSSWQEIYESLSDEALALKIADLWRRDTGFTQMATPSGKSVQAALDELREQLAAAIRVQTNRGGGPARSGLVDLRGMGDNAGAALEPGRQF